MAAYLLDTNLLLRFVDAASPHHEVVDAPAADTYSPYAMYAIAPNTTTPATGTAGR